MVSVLMKGVCIHRLFDVMKMESQLYLADLLKMLKMKKVVQCRLGYQMLEL
mgnify:CR=1 FL=1